MNWIKTAAISLAGYFWMVSRVVAADDPAQWEYRNQWDLAWRIINFLIIAFVIVRFGKEPLRKFLSGRSQEIDREFKTANRLKEDAEQEYQEILAEVSRVDEQIAELCRVIESQGEMQKKRILEEANATAQRLIAEAEAHVDFELRKARHHLKDELVDMAIALAEEKIRKKISRKDQQALAEEYIRKLSPEASAA